MDFFNDPKTILKWFKDPLFQTQDVVENTFFRNKGFLPVKEMFRPFFCLILSSLTNLHEHFIKVHEVF